MFVCIKVFAGLKEFYGPELYLEGEDAISVKEVLDELRKMKPEAAALLSRCRYAVSEEFVSSSYQIKNGEDLYLIPPSSGG